MHQVTATARRLYDFIVKYLAEHTYQPSWREMCEAMGWHSLNRVTQVLGRLEETGYIRFGGKSRAIRLLKHKVVTVQIL